MPKQLVKKGDTSRIEYVFVLDSASTTGAGKTGIAFNAAGFTAYYVRTQGSATSITLATQTATGAYSSGGWIEVDATNMPGVYRFDVPDAVFAAGVDKAIVMLKGASGMAPVALEYQLTDFDPEDGTRLGLTALPNAAAAAAGGLPTFGTGTGQLNVSGGRADANVLRWNGTAVPSEHTAGYPIVTVKDGTGTGEIDTASGTVTVGTNNDKSGYSLTSGGEDAIVDKVWDEARSGHVAAGSFGQGVASVQGNVTGSVASVTADVGITQAGADKVWGSTTRTLSAFGFSVTVGTNNDKTGYALTSAERDAGATAALKLDWTTVTGEATRSTLNALRPLRNKVSISGSTMTVTKEDDTTTSWTGTVVTSAAQDPITSIDPT